MQKENVMFGLSEKTLFIWRRHCGFYFFSESGDSSFEDMDLLTY